MSTYGNQFYLFLHLISEPGFFVYDEQLAFVYAFKASH